MRRRDHLFDAWVQAAKNRATVKLMDGRTAVLVAVRQNSMSCKIKLMDGKHYNIWVDDIALVKPRFSSEQASSWVLLPVWKAPVHSPGTHHRSLRARPSRNWLQVTPNPRALHPAFLPPRQSDEETQPLPSK